VGITYLQAVIIGALQGVTELFPISSLGHSVLLPAWIGGSWQHLVTQSSQANSEGSAYLTFIVAVHVGTAIALLLYYLRAWIRIIGSLITSIRTRSITTPTQRLAWLIVVATIPAGALGLALEHSFRTLFAKPLAAAAFLTVNGVILLVAERLRRRLPEPEHEARAGETLETERELDRAATEDSLVTTRVSFKDAVAVGVAQTAALLAGISRSGITMTAGLLRGLDYETAMNFGFLLATPIIFAAGFLKLPTLAHHSAAGIRGPAVVGAVVAFAAALLAVRFLSRWFKTRTFTPFGVYCLLVGVASIARFA
jgi:undecaprenyl-diphosphatase